jgi:hypothetical protein
MPQWKSGQMTVIRKAFGPSRQGSALFSILPESFS